jgi:hypothetical protein
MAEERNVIIGDVMVRDPTEAPIPAREEQLNGKRR